MCSIVLPGCSLRNYSMQCGRTGNLSGFFMVLLSVIKCQLAFLSHTSTIIGTVIIIIMAYLYRWVPCLHLQDEGWCALVLRESVSCWMSVNQMEKLWVHFTRYKYMYMVALWIVHQPCKLEIASLNLLRAAQLLKNIWLHVYTLTTNLMSLKNNYSCFCSVQTCVFDLWIADADWCSFLVPKFNKAVPLSPHDCGKSLKVVYTSM